MSNSTIDLAAKILDECRARIQANMAKKYRTSKGERWINASGRSLAAFQVEVSERLAAARSLNALDWILLRRQGTA